MVKSGRPPKDETRDITIRARFYEDEVKKLDYCCQVTGKSRSEIIREGIEIVYQKIMEDNHERGNDERSK